MPDRLVLGPVVQTPAPARCAPRGFQPHLREEVFGDESDDVAPRADHQFAQYSGQLGLGGADRGVPAGRYGAVGPARGRENRDRAFGLGQPTPRVANGGPPRPVRGISITVAGFQRRRAGVAKAISRAAAELGVTERSLQRATQAELGRSPRDFVDDIRLERAAHLLRTTALTVDTVAAKVGYLNSGTLRNLVRRRRGMSMAEFRSAGPMW